MHALWIIVLTSISANNVYSAPYPVYNAIGSYYEAGYQLGQQASDRIAKYIKMNPDTIRMKEYISTTNGAFEFNTLLSYNEPLYPHYFDELHGISDGSHINYTDILLINFEYELDALMRMNNYSLYSVDSCSDILVYNDDTFIGWGHNEDDPRNGLTTGYFSNITYITNKTTLNIFGFYGVPGYYSAEPAISITNNIYLTTNYLFPVHVTPYGKAAAFIMRSVLESLNLQDAISMICDYGGNVSVGCSFNVGYKDKNNVIKVVNIENYMNECSVLNINNKNYSYHFNLYERLNIDQYEDVSSVHRRNRTIQIINNDNGTLTDMNQIIYILGDTQDQQYPIYRNGSVATLMTSLYDLKNGFAYFYEQCNPKHCNPSITLNL
eukprot:194951_1